MAQLTAEQRERYWKYNIKLTVTLLVIWFVVAYLLGGLFAGALNQVVIGGFPLGYYIAAQGSIIVFVIEIAVYARLMNKLDLDYGIREEA
jgi:putative solute:sodium symporter small subunit